MHLGDYCARQGIPLDEKIQEDIDKKVRNFAYEIIQGKGATYYGIGSALAKIADVILHDQRSILTVSAPHPKDPNLSGICISMPHLVGGKGIISSFPLILDNEERQLLKKSADKVRSVVNEVKEML